MQQTNVLHVYTDKEEYYIAYDKADCRQLLKTMLGPHYDEKAILIKLPDEQIFTLFDAKTEKQKTCGEWAKDKGRGYFCSNISLG